MFETAAGHGNALDILFVKKLCPQRRDSNGLLILWPIQSPPVVCFWLWPECLWIETPLESEENGVLKQDLPEAAQCCSSVYLINTCCSWKWMHLHVWSYHIACKTLFGLCWTSCTRCLGKHLLGFMSKEPFNGMGNTCLHCAVMIQRPHTPFGSSCFSHVPSYTLQKCLSFQYLCFKMASEYLSALGGAWTHCINSIVMKLKAFILWNKCLWVTWLSSVAIVQDTNPSILWDRDFDLFTWYLDPM